MTRLDLSISLFTMHTALSVQGVMNEGKMAAATDDTAKANEQYFGTISTITNFTLNSRRDVGGH